MILHENDNHLGYGSRVIELQNISVRHGTIDALRSVSAVIYPGRVTALAGRNGSGKSTLLGVIAGTQAHTGTVSGTTGARIAFVVQRSAVTAALPLTVRDVVTMGAWGRRGRWRPLTRDDRDAVTASIHALGLDGLERRRFHDLSGGQRQRTLVAQGLAQRGDVLLLDEPTVGLDAEARQMIERAIESETGRGTTVLHATHDAGVIRSAASVIRLDAGELRGGVMPERR